MARKARKKKRSALRTFLFSLLFVVVISVLFLLWLFWKDVQRSEMLGDKKGAPVEPQRKSQEKISDEERKKLDEILKRRQ